jgi:hypothetical protein
MAEGEIVENADVMAAGQEEPDGVAADVPGAAGDEDSHGGIIAGSVDGSLQRSTIMGRYADLIF